jgi:hypothetical protein
MASAAADTTQAVQEAIAQLQKVTTVEGGSLHDHLVKLVSKVRASCGWQLRPLTPRLSPRPSCWFKRQTRRQRMRA